MKIKYLFFFVICVSSFANAAPVPPGPVPGGAEPAMNLRFFFNHEPLSYYADIAVTSETDRRVLKSGTLGAYYQLFDELRLGAFYKRSYGIRHDEDWITTGQWAWRNTNDRGEDFWILDATPRVSLDFFGHENFVAELKSRFINNIYNHNQTLSVRPGLTYFWLKDDQAFINFFLQYELQFALNFGIQSVNEKWLYLGALYRAASFLDIGIYNALKWETWGNYADYTRRGGADYKITTQTYVIGLMGVFHFGETK